MIATAAIAGAALAQPAQGSEYRFELVGRELKQGYALVTKRLVHRHISKVVPGAIAFMSRIDMSSDGMDDNDGVAGAHANTLPGYLRFKTDLVMEGDWELLLMAKVPGEAGYVRTKLILTAVP